MKTSLYTIAAFLCIVSISQADVVDIVANGPTSNVETISQVVLQVSDGSGTNKVTQIAPATGTTQSADSAILQSITTSSIVLNSFNSVVPTITNDTFPSLAPGIEVLSNGTQTGVSETDFLDQLAEVHSNGDLLNYLRVDGGDFEPQWDIQYSAPLNLNDYLVFEERDGNTTFTVEALDANGNLIDSADANSLSFTGASYQWSIGLSNSADPFGNQPQVLSVISLSLFEATVPISGFRIKDTGNADFKFFLASAVPEPSSTSIIMFGSLAVFLRRRRRLTA